MNTQESDRFTKDLDKYLDIFQWMRMNLSQYELDGLRCGKPAFGPRGILKGATKEVLEAFHTAFSDKGLGYGGDGYWYEKWMEEEEEAMAEMEEDEYEEEDEELAPEFDWSEWTDDERELALQLSDALCDFADYDSVNPDEASTLDEDSLRECIERWLRSDDPSAVAHAYKVAEYGGYDISDLAAEAKAEAEQRHLCAVLGEDAEDRKNEPVGARRI